ncbi:MAG: N-acetylneuraminate synthase [Bacillota bacterium]|uniref:N-acetylneuraminate synthase n=1 Tax=Thermanaerosceptrum fracticalcis TaxID=1712410 RepID=A0A7G6E4K9_THEFR|nr:N-acetylneuraminate synthase [Thermanaerosceptrum fracticalcis]QNB47013.1 N-acetylneuraminate synthase [Thermanaerosceptrum fracticalcis]
MTNSNRVFIIAEAGVNHNGSLEMALQLVDQAVSAGADAIKFQTFKAHKIVCRQAPLAEYQKKNTNTQQSQYTMLKKLELNEDDHFQLLDYCVKKGIQFISSPFDLESVDLLASFNIPQFKIGSGEISNGPLLLKVARTGKEVILSTGMSTLGDVELALSVLAFGYTAEGKIPCLGSFQEAYFSEAGQKAIAEKVTLLHCTTEYPAPYEEVNLRAIHTLQQAFGLPVGISDHTEGIAIPIAAVALGATVVEKHFTLDRSLPGPDHKASLEPPELAAMVQAIRQVESALGSFRKIPTPSELKNRNIARKSLVAAKEIKLGEIFTVENLDCKRPGNGLSPMHIWDKLGKTSPRNYAEEEQID